LGSLLRVLGLTGILRLVIRLTMDQQVPLGLKFIIPLAPKDVVLEHIRGRGQSGGAGDDDRGSKEKVIEGSYRYEDEDPKPDR
jgi:hypothetical protein